MGVLDVEVFDKLAIDQQEALADGDGFAVCQNDAARPCDLLARRREYLVRRRDRLGMNQRLPVKPESTALSAFGDETLIVGKIEVNAID
jgi:hypothetical protein